MQKLHIQALIAKIFSAKYQIFTAYSTKLEAAHALESQIAAADANWRQVAILIICVYLCTAYLKGIHLFYAHGKPHMAKHYVGYCRKGSAWGNRNEKQISNVKQRHQSSKDGAVFVTMQRALSEDPMLFETTPELLAICCDFVLLRMNLAS